MRNKLKNIICLMLAVLCMASFSVTAFAYEGGETATAGMFAELTGGIGALTLSGAARIDQVLWAPVPETSQ